MISLQTRPKIDGKSEKCSYWAVVVVAVADAVADAVVVVVVAVVAVIAEVAAVVAVDIIVVVIDVHLRQNVSIIRFKNQDKAVMMSVWWRLPDDGAIK